MRLGLIARSDRTGLGYQTKDYYDHLKPLKTMLIDLSILNGQRQNYDWYKPDLIIKGFPNDLQIKEFLRGLDVVLTAETPYNYSLYTIAHKMGIKVANVINWEFFDHLIHPEYELPDLIIMPSMWHYEDAENFALSKGIKCVYLHHPVDRNKIPFRQRATSKMFHIAGKPASHDRNGTYDFLRACPDGRVTTQDEEYARKLRGEFRHSNIFTGIDNQKTIYDMGDVLVFPRKYGGNCLPLNEALSAGCPVIMPDISPNNHLLPKEWLVPAEIVDSFTPRTKIDIYKTDHNELVKKIQWFREQDISALSLQANEIADSISWTTMKPKWEQELENLISSTS